MASALNQVSEAIDPSGGVRHPLRLVARVDEKLDVRPTQAERGSRIGLTGTGVVQEAGDSVGGSGMAQRLLEDFDDLWRHAGDGDAASGCVSGRGDALSCQALEGVEGGFSCQYSCRIDELIEQRYSLCSTVSS